MNIVGKKTNRKGKNMKLTNSHYDFLKKVAQIYLPATGVLYFALAKIWGFPYGVEIVGTITAFDTFLGTCLEISTKNYNKDSGVTE
jgi:hypothetical protein